jgi:iron complex outermembrane receptor protein
MALLFGASAVVFGTAAYADSAPNASFGVTVIANPAAGVSLLTRAQVAAIFSGATTNWKQVGGADLPIRVITRGALPIEATFETVYLGKGVASVASGTEADAGADLAAVAKTRGAISFVYSTDLGASADVVTVVVNGIRSTDASGVVDLTTVIGSTTNGAYSVQGQTASKVAPTQAGLDSLEAHSTITRDFIEESSSPIAEFTRIAAIAPSVSTAGKSGVGTTNGPGLTEQTLTIRGMSTDFVNVTFDGIPFSDTNDPSFHSTSFFPEPLIGGVDVVRGPGFASNLGYATFGGSENMFSIQPSNTPSLDISESPGSWATNLISARYQSGKQPLLGNGTIVASFNDLTANGYLTDNFVKSRNYALKYEVPLGKATLLDAFGSFNNIYLNQSDAGYPDGATAYERSLYGQNYSLNNNPATANYFGYNNEAKSTDFAYLRLRSSAGPVYFDNKLYTYRYDNETVSADALGTVAPTSTSTGLPSSGTLTCNPSLSAASCAAALTSGTNSAFTANPNDIAGYLKRNKYIVVGDVVDATYDFQSGFVKAGIWLEHSSTDRHNYDIDLTTGQWDYAAGNGCDDNNNVVTNYYVNAAGKIVGQTTKCTKNGLIDGNNGTKGLNAGVLANGAPVAAVNFDQQSAILNAQPFLEAQFRLPSGTTIYPGIRFLNITRLDDASIESKIRVPATDAISYHTTLAFMSVNQKITPSLSAFGQYGQGYEIPDLGTYYVANPNTNSTDPNKSNTIQGGIVGKTPSFTWDADLYSVNFTNLVTKLATDINGSPNCGTGAGTTGLPCNYSNYYNVGGAKYSGVELEGTLLLGRGFALYANYSTDKAVANNTASLQLQNVPLNTAAAGILYKSRKLNGSLILKQTGKQFLNTPPATNDATYAADYAAYQNGLNQIPSYATLDLSLTYHVTPHDTLQINGYNLTSATPLLTPGVTGVSSSALLINQVPASVLVTFRHSLF